MFSPLPFFCVLLAVAGTGLAHNSARLFDTPSVRSIVRRQATQNSTTTNSTTTSNVTQSTASVVPLVLASDKETYYSLISVGGVNFRVAIDTGSSDAWIVSSGCVTAQCKSLPRYPLTYDSPTFVSVNSNATAFNVSFADTTFASGFVAEESISLGNFTVPEQAFGLMNSTNVTFVDDVSGIFGLGFPRLSTIRYLVSNDTPFFTKLAQAGQLVYPFFGVNLERNASYGSLSIGAIDSTIVKNVSLIEWIEVIPFRPIGVQSNVSGYLEWAIPISNITVGNQTFTMEPTYPQETSNQSLALFDIGTPGIFGPYQDVERIFSVIDSSRLVDPTGQWAIPCNTNLTMTITFSTGNYTLLPSDYLIGPTVAEPELCLTWPKASPPSSDGIDWQMGAAFMRTVYTVFSYGIVDKEPPFLGLYPLRPASAVAIPPASLSSLFSSLSLTVATTLPNYVVTTPSLTTPPYTFNSSVPTSDLAMSDLATSLYTPLIEEIVNGAVEKLNVTSLPGAVPSPTLTTLYLTESGTVITSLSPLPTSTVVLGVPPGGFSRSGSKALRPHGVVAILVVVSAFLLAFHGIFL